MNYFVPTTDQLGVLLRSMRKDKGLTQIETARGAGLLPKTVSLLENNPQRSSVGNLFKLISFLNREVHLMDKNETALLELSDGGW